MAKKIHKAHPNGNPHPFKFLTLCGSMVRFGAAETKEHEANCKKCISIYEKLCPTCLGSGMKKEL